MILKNEEILRERWVKVFHQYMEIRHIKSILPGLVIFVLACSLLSPGLAHAKEESTSRNNTRLEAALKRFPKADTNGDGILSLSEAKAFREKHATKKTDAKEKTALPAPTHANLSYGPHERNLLDIWLPENPIAPVPLAIFIHGGGFIDGSKENLDPVILDACRERGVAVAAINYRFITTAPFPAPLRDSARAVQYLRSRAAEFKLDPERFAVYGTSAGAGASMWIAFHDDLANPDGAGPVERASSRVACAGSLSGQTSYDPRVLLEWLGEIVLNHRLVPLIYGTGDREKLLHPDPALDALMKECSPIEQVTKDDPPLFMYYNLTSEKSVGAAIHSVIFGRKLEEKLDALGIENELCTSDSPKKGPIGTERLTAFLFKRLGVAALPDAAGADAAR